jgi:hypothetical protein
MRPSMDLAKTAALEIQKIRTAVNDIIGIYSSSINAKLLDAVKAVESSHRKSPLKRSEVLRMKWVIKKAAEMKIKPAKGRPKDLTKIHKFSVQALAKLRDRTH